MKLIHKEKIENQFVEQYEFDNGYYPNNLKCPGLQICYLLYKSTEINDVILSLDCSNKLANERKMISYCDADKEKEISTLTKLIDICYSNEIDMWSMSMKYKKNTLVIAGSVRENKIALLYESNKELYLFFFLARIEEKTWKQNTYDIVLLNYMMKKFEISLQTTVASLDRFDKYKEIGNEFMHYVIPEVYGFDQLLLINSKRRINIQGYTAKEIIKQFDISELGAYLFLTYLCESPEESKRIMEKGIVSSKVYPCWTQKNQ